MNQTNKQSEYQDRLKKLKEIQKSGIEPYPASAKRTHLAAEALLEFDKLAKNKRTVFVCGRVVLLRSFGKLAFVHLQDVSGKIQTVFEKGKTAEDDFKFLKKIDVGDFIQISGTVFKTQKGEKSILVKNLKLLTKTLRPMPDKWQGLKDEEEKFRKRYLDILTNPETKGLFEKKALFWNSIREFLINKKFMEVETPVLENTTGGADAKPFITHHNALDINVYLRISGGELWQKKLMVAGYEKTFEIGRIFRNEGMDAEHLQDYTQMEFYWAYADYNDGMKLVEDMYKYAAKKTFGTLKFKIGKFDVDLGKKWERYDYSENIKKHTGVDIAKASFEGIQKKLRELKIEYNKKGFNKNRAIDSLWKYCRKKIAGPGFIVNVPVSMSPLAKRLEDNQELTQRFQPLIAGSELGNGYSELNNPVDQAERFESQQKLRDEGDDEAQMHDHSFVKALEHGMPPTCGFGMSERVFAFLANKTVRECQIFPLMKPDEPNDK